MAQHPQLKLTYFDLCGRAEVTRLVLAFGGIPFDDHRIVDPAFEQLKPTLPLGQLPTLDVDGKTFVQSMAIARFAARLAGLYPSGAVDALTVDMVLDTLTDAVNTWVDTMWLTTDEAVKETKIKQAVTETLPKIFALLERHVQGKFFLGDSASVADVFAFDFYTNVVKTSYPEFKVAAFPKVDGVIANVAAVPAIAAYMAKQQA